MLLSITIGLGNEHDSRRLIELIQGLEAKPRELYADSAYDTESKEIPRIYWCRD